MLLRRTLPPRWLILGVLALAVLARTGVAAPDLDDDLARAREILTLLEPQGEYEPTVDYLERLVQYNSHLPELRALSERRHTVPIEVAVERYKPDEGYFPVSVAYGELLNASSAYIEMPAGAARRAKPQLRRAWGDVLVRVSPTLAQAQPHLASVWVSAANRRWPVTLAGAWTRGFAVPLTRSTRVRLSPSGKALAMVSGERTRFIDTDTGNSLHETDGTDVAWLEGGRAQLCVSAEIHVVDPSTWDVIEALPGPASTHWGRFSSDGRLHVVVTGGDLTLWDVREGRQRWTIRAHGDPIRATALFANDEYIATAPQHSVSYGNGTIRIWRADTGQRHTTITHFAGTRIGPITSLESSDTHGVLVAGTQNVDSGLGAFLHVWDVPTLTERRAYHEHAGHVGSPVIGESAPYVGFTYTAPPGLGSYSLSSGKPLQSHVKSASHLSLARTSDMMSEGVGPVQMWWAVGADLPSIPLEPVTIMDTTAPVEAVAAADVAPPEPASEQVEPQQRPSAYSTTEAGMQSAIARAEEILGLARPKDEFENTAEYEARIDAYNALIDELRAIAAMRFDVPMTVEEVGRYDADAEAFPVTISKEGLLAAAKGSLPMPRAKARSAKAQLRKAWASVQVRVVPPTREAIPYPTDISVRYQDKMWPVDFPSAWVRGYTIDYAANGGIVMSSDGSTLAVASQDGVALRTAASGEIIRWLRPGDVQPAQPATYVQHGAIMEFSPDDSRIVEGSAKWARVWNATDGAFDHHLPVDPGFSDVSFHPDGDHVAVGMYSGDATNGTVRIWSMSAQKVVDEFIAHERRILGVQYVNDGLQLVTSGHNLDGRVHVWDMASGQRVRTLLQNVPYPEGGPAAAYIGAYRPAASVVALGGWGAQTSYWSTVDWSEFGRQQVGGPATISPDGLTSVVLDASRRVHFIDATEHVEWQVLAPLPVPSFGENGNVSGAFAYALDGTSLALTRPLAVGGPVHMLWRVGVNLADVPIERLDPADIVMTVAVASPHVPASGPQQVTPAPPNATAPEPVPSERTERTEQEATAPAPGGIVATHALLVGVDDYDHHANLVNPVNDVQTIQAELRDAYSSDTQTLASPTRREFQQALHALADRSYGERDQLLVMFSGHGYFDDRIKRGYLAFRDSKPLEDDPYFESYISHSEVREILERLDCEHVLLVVDSCFAGTLDPLIAMAPGARPVDNPSGLIPAKEFIQRKLRFRTRRYITAGGKEYVPDGRPGQHSPFVRQLLEGLRSYGGSDGILTLEELTLYLERVDPQPRTGELFGNEPGSSFVLVARALDEESAAKFAPLVVEVTPPDAEVAIAGGPPAAETLMKTLQVEAIGATKRRYHLPLGTYEVTVSRAGFGTATRTVELTETGHTLSMSLRRQ